MIVSGKATIKNPKGKVWKEVTSAGVGAPKHARFVTVAMRVNRCFFEF